MDQETFSNEAKCSARVWPNGALQVGRRLECWHEPRMKNSAGLARRPRDAQLAPGAAAGPALNSVRGLGRSAKSPSIGYVPCLETAELPRRRADSRRSAEAAKAHSMLAGEPRRCAGSTSLLGSSGGRSCGALGGPPPRPGRVYPVAMFDLRRRMEAQFLGDGRVKPSRLEAKPWPRSSPAGGLAVYLPLPEVRGARGQ